MNETSPDGSADVIALDIEALEASVRNTGIIADWQAVAAQMPSALLVAHSPSGQVVFCNAIAARLLRLPVKNEHALDCEDRHFYARFLCANGQPCTLEEHPILRAARYGDVTDREEMLYGHADNLISFLAVSASPLRDAQGQIIAAIATLDNISARKQYEQDSHRRYEQTLDRLEALQVAQEDLLIMRAQLELERHRYHEMFQFATDGYLVTDLHGVIREANQEACNKLNLSPNYVNGKIFANYIHVEDRIAFRALMGRMEHERRRVDWEGRLTPRRDGIRDMQLTVATIWDYETDTPQALRWLLHDITHRRNLERARQKDQQRLLDQEHRAGVMEERTRIAQEFHDTLAQGFTGISFLLSAAEDALPEHPQQAEAQIARARQVATQSIGEARQAIRAMRSEALDADNLPAAFATLVDQITTTTGIRATLEIKGAVRGLPSQVANDLLRIGQEACTNALKHAQAGELHLCLKYEPEEVSLCIRDDGQGFAADTPSSGTGYGLIGMRERARRIQGNLEIHTEAGEGTTIAVTVPLTRP